MEKGKIVLTWEKGVEERLRKDLSQLPAARSAQPFPHLMVAVVGIPGSGKTTSAKILAQQLADVGCLLMPFDGYHFPKAALEQFSNPTDAIYRRGAPDTFDAAALARDLRRIREGNEPVISLPGFDHARGDPEEGAHVFRRDQHRVVVCEGLYLLHDQDGWDHIRECFDLSIFVEANLDVCMERLKIRNRVIPGYTPEEIDIRVDAVDRKNGLTVMASKARADVVVKSAAA